MKNARVMSFINDTADQQKKLHTLTRGGTKESAVRTELSRWGFLHMRLQALIYGRTVLSDSFIFNNFFLHELKDEDYRSFVDCVSSNGFIEVRHRENSVKGLLVREYNIRDYWSEAFQKRMLEAGKLLKKNFNDITKHYGKEISTAQEYIDALREGRFEVGEDFFKNGANGADLSDEFKKYCKIVPRADWLVEGLRKHKLLKPWENTGDTDPNVTKLWGERKEKLVEVTKDFKNTYPEVNSKAVSELIKEIETSKNYDGSKVERLCAEFGVPEAENFFQRRFHEDIFCKGLTLQHKCDYMQVVNTGNYNDSRILTLEMSRNEADKLRNMAWSEFSKRCKTNKFLKDQGELISKINDKNSTANDRQISFKKILWESFGLRSEQNKTIIPYEKETVTAASLTNRYSLSDALYIVGSKDSNDGVTVSFNEGYAQSIFPRRRLIS